MKALRVLPFLPLLAVWIEPASAQRIFTGAEIGAYHRDFCPPLSRELGNTGATYACTTSAGTRENMERVRSNPRDIGYGQLDVFSLESGQLSMGSALEILRQDDVKECVFAVTRSKEINSFGELSAYASALRIFVPPLTSGSAGTFQFLRSVDRNGLGRAGRVTNSTTADEAIRAALSSDDGVAFFVQFPDPDNERFKMVRELGGHFVPVLDRAILAQTIGGKAVYSAQETRVQNGRWLEGGGIKVTTACVPVVVFTGNPDRIRDTAERRAHNEMINAVKAIPLNALVPPQSPFRAATARARELSQEGRERIFSYSARARDRVLPFFERIVERMIEHAAPRR